jgi:hypothetical protein
VFCALAMTAQSSTAVKVTVMVGFIRSPREMK